MAYLIHFPRFILINCFLLFSVSCTSIPPSIGNRMPASGSTSFTRLDQQYIDLLTKFPVWQSVSIDALKIGELVTASNPLGKKWSVVRSENGALSLIEQTRLTLSIDCAKPPDKWAASLSRTSATLRLSDDFDFAQMFLIPFTKRPCGEPLKSFRMTRIDQTRFVLETDSGQVIFFPATDDAPVAKFRTQDKRVHVWTAPLGINRISTDLVGIPFEQTYYLHYDLNSSKLPVVLDPSFPDQHIQALDNSIKELNSALGRDFFYRVKDKASVDVADCFSSRKICVRWMGGADLPWSGWALSGASSFDPDTGLIIGGMVTASIPTGIPLSQAPVEIQHAYTKQTWNMADLERLYLKRDDFNHYRHPDPEPHLRRVMIHELGHVSGLEHNFMGSLDGTPSNPSASVMEYPPFIAYNRNSAHFQDFDFQAFDFVYRGQPLKKNYRTCAEMDLATALIPGGTKDPNCRQMDVGSPEKWFAGLAKYSEEGVFAKDLTVSPSRDLLMELGMFLISDHRVTAAQTDFVRNYLCKQERLSEIKSRLQVDYGVNLLCN